MTASFDFTAVSNQPNATGFELDLMTAAAMVPASIDPLKVTSTTLSSPLGVTTISEIDTPDYALHGTFVIHRTGSAVLIGGGLYSNHYTQTVDLVSSTITSVTPLDTTGNSISIHFSTPQPYLLLAGTAIGLFVNDGDVFNFSMLADHVETTDHRETINLGGGDDWVMSRGGNDLIDGGTGVDTAAFAGDRADYTVTNMQVGFAVTDLASGDTDALVNVERLEFGDARLAIDIDGTNGAGAVSPHLPGGVRPHAGYRRADVLGGKGGSGTVDNRHGGALHRFRRVPDALRIEHAPGPGLRRPDLR